MDEVTQNSLPSNVIEYSAAIEQLSCGQFTSRFSESARKYFASQYGAPFYALSRLAPEILNMPSANIVFGGPVGMFAEEGGRWLSLYQRVFKPLGKLSSTICVGAKPRPIKAPKPLLFQPPQSVIIKPWSRYLSELSTLPDLLILYAPHSFSEHIIVIDSLSELRLACKVLLGFQSRAEAVLIKSLYIARGFVATEIMGFDLSNETPQHFSNGAWWISIASCSDISQTHDYEAVLDSVRGGFVYYEQLISQSDSQSERSDIAEMYATWSPVRIGDIDICHCFHFSSQSGLDLNSGRFFRNVMDSMGVSKYEWGDAFIPEDLLDMVPDILPDLNADENRFRRMIWISKAYSEKRRRDEQISFQNLASIENQNVIDRPEASSDNEVCSGIEIDAVAEPGTNEHDSSGNPKPKILRSRLSRATGTVNVLAISGRLGKLDKVPDDAFIKTKALILGWLKNKGYTGLAPFGNTAIELPYGEVTIETDDKTVWSLRFDDRQKMEQGAIWRVEATLINAEEPAIGLRLSQVRKSEEAPEPVSGVPKVIATIASKIGLHDAGFPLSSHALLFKGDRDSNDLIRLLIKADRTHSIIAISATSSSNIDPSVDRLAARLTGVAHVVLIDRETSDRMIETFGRERALFGNAIRLYRPGFSASSDPFQHRIWTFKGGQLPVWIANDIAEEACAISLEVEDIDDRVPSFHAIRNLLSETRHESLRKQSISIASSADEKIQSLVSIKSELESLLSQYRKQNDELESRVNELVNSLRKLNVELQEIRRERDVALDESRLLQNKLDNRWADDSDPIQTIEYQTNYPDSWDDLETWVEIYGDDKLVLHPLAAKAARESPFIDIPFAYKAMEYLVKYYVPMRMRNKDDVQPFIANQSALDELGLVLSKVGTAVDMNRYKQEYRRQYNGKSIWLEDHLKKGVGHDPSVIFRLYFYFDEANAKVVVGHLPTHLTNRTSHSG